jgi:hypothetical protein
VSSPSSATTAHSSTGASGLIAPLRLKWREWTDGQRYGVRVSAYGISHRRTYRPRQRLMIDHGIGVIAHRTGIIDHGQQ